MNNKKTVFETIKEIEDQIDAMVMVVMSKWELVKKIENDTHRITEMAKLSGRLETLKEVKDFLGTVTVYAKKPKKEFYVGDYVETKKHGHLGRIYKKDIMYEGSNGGGKRDAWTEAQLKPITDAELVEPWYSVLTLKGGAVYVSQSDLIEKDKFDLQNPWESFHFGKE